MTCGVKVGINEGLRERHEEDENREEITRVQERGEFKCVTLDESLLLLVGTVTRSDRTGFSCFFFYFRIYHISFFFFFAFTFNLSLAKIG